MNIKYISLQGRPLRVSPQQPADSSPVPPPPKPKSATTEATKQQNEEILNAILPPRYSFYPSTIYCSPGTAHTVTYLNLWYYREWTEGYQLWVQQVSSAPCTRTDVVRLEELLDMKMQQRQARETGICPVRRELYSQCFGKEEAEMPVTTQVIVLIMLDGL